MVKNIVSSIFIYILLVGCESPLMCEDCYLDMSISDSTVDDNGYYHIDFLEEYVQTFTTIEATTGITSYNQKVKWMSNREISIGGYWSDVVNGSSYTNDHGNAYTVLGVWNNFIGDTIKIYSGYTDNCNILHVDSLEVIID